MGLLIQLGTGTCVQFMKTNENLRKKLLLLLCDNYYGRS